MAVEQLNLLDLPVEAPAPRPTRRQPRRDDSPGLVAGQVLVEHRYPEALAFLREHGSDAVAVLHVLAADATELDGRLLVRASTRGVAGRLGFLSKDSAHRRLRQLRRAGVLEVLPSTGAMDPPSYVLHLDGTGIAVTCPDPPAEGAPP